MAVSFLCSVMEAAILSINPGKIALLAKKYPKAGKICAKFKDDIEKPISVILILNTTAHTFGAAIAGAEFDKLFGSEHIWLFSLCFTIAMVQFTEILPKTLGVRFNVFVMRWSAGGLKMCISLMKPFISLIEMLNSPFSMKYSRSADKPQSCVDEIMAVAAQARAKSEISKAQEREIREILHSKQK